VVACPQARVGSAAPVTLWVSSQPNLYIKVEFVKRENAEKIKQVFLYIFSFPFCNVAAPAAQVKLQSGGQCFVMMQPILIRKNKISE